MIKINGMVTPASMRSIQNGHLQLMGAVKPEIRGPRTGPKVVAAIKHAIATPRLRGSAKISAYSPPTTATGADAKTPHMNRNIKNAVQLGARAVAMVKMVYSKKATRNTIFRP
jgi:hypothetical protein